jgi:hypothetical protein
VLGLPGLVVGIVFLIWFHRAATAAARLRRPARHTPGWSVVGWLIPVVNFLFPYQSANDLFRPGEAGRATVGPWWTAYLVAQLSLQPIAGVIGYRDDVPGAAVVAVAALAFVVWLWAFLQARAFVDAATASLTAELRR